MAERNRGVVVKWFAGAGKNYGFIRPDGADSDLFFYHDACRCTPHLGLGVTFTIGADREGRPRAENIEQAGASAAAERVFREPVRP